MITDFKLSILSGRHVIVEIFGIIDYDGLGLAISADDVVYGHFRFCQIYKRGVLTHLVK